MTTNEEIRIMKHFLSILFSFFAFFCLPISSNFESGFTTDIIAESAQSEICILTLHENGKGEFWVNNGWSEIYQIEVTKGAFLDMSINPQ